MDSIAHCNVNAMGTTIIPGSGPKPAKMMNVLENHALFNCTDMQKENKRIFPLHNKCDKQNNREATECLLNSLEETLCKQIRVKLEDEMLFADVAMLFIDTVGPQNSKLHVSLKKKIMDFDASKHLGANIEAMASDLRKTVTSMMRGNAHDGKHNATTAQKLANAGGSNNEECSTLMHDCLNTVKE